MTLLSLCLCLGGNDWSTLESVWRTSFLWVNHKECDQTLQDLFGVKKVVVYILLCHVQKNYFSCFRREMRRKRRSRWRRKIPKRVKIWGGDQPETGKTSATGGCGQGGGVKGSEGIPGSGVQGPGSRDRGPGTGVQGAGSRERGPESGVQGAEMSPKQLWIQCLVHWLIVNVRDGDSDLCPSFIYYTSWIHPQLRIKSIYCLSS